MRNNRRGKTAKVFVYIKPDLIWFLVRHGKPFAREAIIKDGKSASLFYRPEKFDVIVYNPQLTEIRMNAVSKGEKELYRSRFGFYFFNDPDFFDSRSKFTLEPLRNIGPDAILCDDIDDMEWVKLKEIQIYRGGFYHEIEIVKAKDIFRLLKDKGKSFPQSGSLIKASFSIKFSNSKTPRTLILSSGNRAQFKRDDDAEAIEDWLTRRGFIIFEPESMNEP